MTQVHFTINSQEIQSLIENSTKDNISKLILTKLFNELMIYLKDINGMKKHY